MIETEQKLQDEITQLTIDKASLESDMVDLKYDLRVCEEKKSDLEDTISELEDHDYESDAFDLSTLVNQMKYEFFKENFDKINLEQLENLVK